MGESAVFASDILAGYGTLTVTGGPVTLITIPAGRTWHGTISMNTSITNTAAAAAAAIAAGSVSTAGAGVTPVAGVLLGCSAYAGANALGGTVGEAANNSAFLDCWIAAPGANPVTLTFGTFVSGGGNAALQAAASGILVASWIPR